MGRPFSEPENDPLDIILIILGDPDIVHISTTAGSFMDLAQRQEAMETRTTRS